jgi:hypothetical protein
MKTQSAQYLFQYWNRLREGSPAPRRTQIEPSDIRDVLSQTFILEAKHNNAEVNFRLAGTAISNLFGRTLRGTPIRALFQEQTKPILSRLMRNCYQDCSVVLLGFDATSRSGRHTLLEIMMLPLQDESEGHRILGCLVPHKYQFWHGLDPIEKMDLHSIRLVDAEREPLFLANRPEINLIPAIAPDEHHLKSFAANTVPKALQLTVIQGGKNT